MQEKEKIRPSNEFIPGVAQTSVDIYWMRLTIMGKQWIPKYSSHRTLYSGAYIWQVY